MNRDMLTSQWRRALCRWFGRRELAPVAACVHFGGFRYSAGGFNPYRDYVAALARGEARDAVRERFVDFLRHHRPRDLGNALGLTLERSYPLWLFPWSRRRAVAGARNGGWYEDPEACPDLLTHFSERGIPRHRIEEEFSWLEQCLQSITDRGYRPRQYRSWIETRRLTRDEDTSAWLVEDGNHRLAVLSTLGHATVEVRHLPWREVRQRDLLRWPLVRAGIFSPGDAARVFEAYFRDASRPARASNPATILDACPP